MNNQEKKTEPSIFDWMVKLFEFPATILITLMWACRFLYLAKKRQFETEDFSNALLRVWKENVDYASFHLFLWKMPITIIFWSSLIFFMIFL
jgi:hypothetical protein